MFAHNYIYNFELTNYKLMEARYSFETRTFFFILKHPSLHMPKIRIVMPEKDAININTLGALSYKIVKGGHDWINYYCSQVINNLFPTMNSIIRTSPVRGCRRWITMKPINKPQG